MDIQTYSAADVERGRDVGDESSTLVEYFQVIVRRKWWILSPLVLVPLAALIFSIQQAPLYQASAQVLLSQQNLAASVLGIPDTNSALQPDRVAQTQADLARVPEIAQRTLAAAGLRNRSPLQFLAHSSVSTTSNSDLLEFDVRDRNPALARLLATEYARQFISYRNQLNTSELNHAQHSLEQRLNRLRADGLTNSSLYADLTAKNQQLIAIETLQTASAVLVRSADSAPRVRPRPVLDTMLGLGLGFLLGIGSAFLREALDTRVRRPDEIERILELPLLARLPAPPEGATDAIAKELSGPYAESIRALRVRLGLTRPQSTLQVLMATSALEREGKSTTISSLAIALAQAGRTVVLCDLDARRPALDRLFGIEERPGLLDVALHHVELEEALATIPIPAHLYPAGGSKGEGKGRRVAGLLEVLPLGHVPPDPSEFISSDAVAEILGRLRDRSDVVLVDAPPLLGLGDAMALAAHVDGLLLVLRLDLIRRPTLKELQRVLYSFPVPTVGFVATAANVGDGYRSRRSDRRHWSWSRPTAREQLATRGKPKAARRSPDPT